MTATEYKAKEKTKKKKKTRCRKTINGHKTTKKDTIEKMQ